MPHGYKWSIQVGKERAPRKLPKGPRENLKDEHDTDEDLDERERVRRAARSGDHAFEEEASSTMVPRSSGGQESSTRLILSRECSRLEGSPPESLGEEKLMKVKFMKEMPDDTPAAASGDVSRALG